MQLRGRRVGGLRQTGESTLIVSSAQNRRGFSQTTYRIEVDEGEQALRACDFAK